MLGLMKRLHDILNGPPPAGPGELPPLLHAMEVVGKDYLDGWETLKHSEYRAFLVDNMRRMTTGDCQERFGLLLHSAIGETTEKMAALAAKRQLSGHERNQMDSWTTEIRALSEVADAYDTCVQHGREDELLPFMEDALNYMVRAEKFFWLEAFNDNPAKEVHDRVKLKFLDRKFGKAFMDAKTRNGIEGHANRIAKLEEWGHAETHEEAWEKVS